MADAPSLNINPDEIFQQLARRQNLQNVKPCKINVREMPDELFAQEPATNISAIINIYAPASVIKELNEKYQ